VLAVLAMLARKCALRVAAGGCAPPIPSAPRHGLGCPRPGRESRLFQPNRKAALKGFSPIADGTFLFWGTRGHFYFALTAEVSA
jgi:hypothetical protein